MQKQDARLDFYHLLCWACSGHHKAKPRHVLLAMLNDRGYSFNDREFRDLFAQMANDYLLGSCDKGYFVISTDDDLRVACESLDKKAEAIAIRKNALKGRFAEKHGYVPDTMQGELGL
ncbi:MAG: hypothetical protein A2206_01390 [Candidatus Magasanikbacteria bacterium RIFOXYA1_FULL_40_8]|uniref:Uncharacterized protein n=1 Tax=Candidatus Magasanikbacteria bacterium RIFOXYA1_FULL_40_8 TaxID=1798694 RepID=A0A1F6NT56_9BACT|nr:MAG: hypothetical protein A2206_01390 [Candidatus Magasanikbacteria bacterium RIFOXYA1_FULL_40_8]